jgi:hypothetical protein
MNAVASIEIEAHRIIESERDLASLSFGEQIAAIGHAMAKVPQAELPLKHHFAPGVYVREIAMPADTVVIGHIHRTEHLNILIQGSCMIVHADGNREILQAPMTFVSKAGVQKVLLILEDMIWQTVHVTDETDIEKLEAILTEPVPADPLERLT